MLTTAQRATLAADIAADPVLNALPHNSDGAFAIAQAYNLLASPTWYVWRTDASTDEIFDAVTWASLTPTDAPDGTATYTNRALSAQARQINLQIMLQGRQTLNASKLKIRQALTDALQNLPTGAGGALLDAGWSSVKATLYRPATRLEKLFSTGTGTTGVPANLAASADAGQLVQGQISYQEVMDARG